jgi:hypothetical protein
MAEEALVLAGWAFAFPEGGVGGHGCNSIISGDGLKPTSEVSTPSGLAEEGGAG